MSKDKTSRQDSDQTIKSDRRYRAVRDDSRVVPAGVQVPAAERSVGDEITLNGQRYLALRFVTVSGEADVFLIEKDGRGLVLKLHYSSFAPKLDIAEVVKGVRHPNIVELVDYGDYQGRFFEIMEYAEGGSLDAVLPVRDARVLREMVADTVNALHYCHSHGIIHRDVRPQNLFFRKADRKALAVGHFRIDPRSLDPESTIRRVEEVIYRSPEMHLGVPGKAAIDERADYYSLGITLLHLWAGAQPFEDVSHYELVRMKIEGRVPIPDDLPEELQGLIRGLVTVDPSQRWGYEEVQRWLGSKDAQDHITGVEDASNLDDDLQQLENLIGLDSVKRAIRTLINYLEVDKARASAGGRETPLTIHFVFSGNPGTGKTTVARILADIFKAMGLLPKGHLVEVTRKDLIGQYMGQTAPRTNNRIDEAIGGVLFVDEAYALVPEGPGDSYGKEAVTTLLERMENDRGRFVVIAAGYKDEMETFLDSNPGLRSRFTKHVDFEDYTPTELKEIFLSMAKSKGMELSERVEELLTQLFTDMYDRRDRNFANGRTVRNIFDMVLQNQANRVAALPEESRSPDTLSIITPDDFGSIEGVKPT